MSQEPSAFWRFAATIGLATPQDSVQRALSERSRRRRKQIATALLVAWIALFVADVVVGDGPRWWFAAMTVIGLTGAVVTLRDLNRQHLQRPDQAPQRKQG